MCNFFLHFITNLKHAGYEKEGVNQFRENSKQKPNSPLLGKKTGCENSDSGLNNYTVVSFQLKVLSNFIFTSQRTKQGFPTTCVSFVPKDVTRRRNMSSF